MGVSDELDYGTAQTICAEQVEEARAWAQRWKHAFWGALTLAGVALVGNIGQAYQPKVRPFYIEVACTDCPASRVIGFAPEVVTLKQEAVKEELRKFVAMLRRVSVDKKLMADDWSKDGLYAHVTGRGRKLLNEVVTAQNPLTRKEIVSVEFRSALPLSEKTYEVRWTEKRYTAKLEPLDTQGYRGVVTWVRQEPQTEEEIRHNQLSLFVDNFSIEKE